MAINASNASSSKSSNPSHWGLMTPYEAQEAARAATAKSSSSSSTKTTSTPAKTTSTPTKTTSTPAKTTSTPTKTTTTVKTTTATKTTSSSPTTSSSSTSSATPAYIVSSSAKEAAAKVSSSSSSGASSSSSSASNSATGAMGASYSSDMAREAAAREAAAQATAAQSKAAQAYEATKKMITPAPKTNAVVVGSAYTVQDRGDIGMNAKGQIYASPVKTSTKTTANLSSAQTTAQLAAQAAAMAMENMINAASKKRTDQNRNNAQLQAAAMSTETMINDAARKVSAQQSKLVSQQSNISDAFTRATVAERMTQSANDSMTQMLNDHKVASQKALASKTEIAIQGKMQQTSSGVDLAMLQLLSPIGYKSLHKQALVEIITDTHKKLAGIEVGASKMQNVVEQKVSSQKLLVAKTETAIQTQMQQKSSGVDLDMLRQMSSVGYNSLRGEAAVDLFKANALLDHILDPSLTIAWKVAIGVEKPANEIRETIKLDQRYLFDHAKTTLATRIDQLDKGTAPKDGDWGMEAVVAGSMYKEISVEKRVETLYNLSVQKGQLTSVQQKELGDIYDLTSSNFIVHASTMGSMSMEKAEFQKGLERIAEGQTYLGYTLINAAVGRMAQYNLDAGVGISNYDDPANSRFKIESKGAVAAGDVAIGSITVAPVVTQLDSPPAATPLLASVTQSMTSVESKGSNAIVDSRKFSEYIFKEGAAPGKDVVYKNLGYGAKDSEMLMKIYQEQGAVKYSSGNYTIGKLNEHGQRINIEIELNGIGSAAGKTSYLNSGWMIKSDDSISLNTPFSGFSK